MRLVLVLLNLVFVVLAATGFVSEGFTLSGALWAFACLAGAAVCGGIFLWCGRREVAEREDSEETKK